MTLNEIKEYYPGRTGFKFSGTIDELPEILKTSFNTLTVDYVLYFFLDSTDLDPATITALDTRIEAI